MRFKVYAVMALCFISKAVSLAQLLARLIVYNYNFRRGFPHLAVEKVVVVLRTSLIILWTALKSLEFDPQSANIHVLS